MMLKKKIILQTFNKKDLMHLNIRGLRSKIEELQLILKERIIDMYSVNKISLNPKIKVDIPEYHLA